MSKRVIAATSTVPMEQRPALTTVANVELLSTGTYHLASGLTTFTDEDLADAVLAQEDPGVLPPRIKLGHTDERFNGDGDPALGKVLNMRLSEDQQTIIGDFVGVPTWLADVMPSAYPSRSVEGDFEVEVGFEGKIGGESITGRKYRLVLTAVALLGTAMPGVEVLEDLKGLFDGTTLETPKAGGVQGGATFEAMKVKAARSSQVAASLNIEDVRRAYYEEIEDNPVAFCYWIRAIYIDPNELIVDTGEGDSSLLRVPFDVTADGTITFGTASPVKVEYVAAGGSVAAAQGRRLTTYANRDDARPDESEEHMTEEQKNQLRKVLDLADDADEAAITAALAAKAEAEPEGEPAEGTPQPEGEPAGEPGKGSDGEPAETPASPELPASDPETAPADAVTDAEPVAAKGSVTVDASALAELQRDAKAGRAARTEQLNERREAMLTGAVKAGKFPRSSKDHYRKLHVKDPKGTEEFIASLADGIVPVNLEETGEAGQLDADASAYPAGWFPEVTAQKGDERKFVVAE